jgi:ABC-type Na+ efflux pump permease subunit
MGKNILGKWGIYLLALQALFAIVIYGIASSVGMDDTVATKLALATAGIVAIVCIIITMFKLKTVGVAIATSSLSAVLLIFCIFAHVYVFASILGFISFAVSFVAAMIVKREEADENIFFLILEALPVIGAFIYLSSQLDKEREKMMRGGR